MKYACIGEHLKHSFSKEIHNMLADYEYEIKEIPKENLNAFMRDADFLGINVTIPYKEAVIPHLAEIDDAARAIGAVNTVIKKADKLYGYNTDFYGMCELFRHADVSPKGKKAVILGSGGTAKTAKAVLEFLGASEILIASRNKRYGIISYDELYEKHKDTEIIVNTTPVGMFPELDKSPVELARFSTLSGVIDVIYNPLRTKLILDARAMGIPAEGGLYMLVAQAVRASEIFLQNTYEPDTVTKVFEKILRDKENIVFIGMPSSGKTTLGQAIAKALSREFYDSDVEIEKLYGSIPEIFKSKGELLFRDYESEAIRELSKKTGAVIATGGGAVLRKENVRFLKMNGKIIFLDRALDDLLPTSNRPLSSDFSSLKKRYEERYGIYKESCDLKIEVKGTPDELSEKLKEILF